MSTELVLVVDKSGSMGSMVEMATKAINKVVKSQAKVGGDCNLTVVMFADSPKIICDSKPISRKSGVEVSVDPFGQEIFTDMGGTALLDAVGFTIEHLEKRKKCDKVIIAVLTDGGENESRKYDIESLSKAILKKEIESWEFIYMIACDQDLTRNACMQLASQLGFAMILGVNANEYAHSVDLINKHIVNIRENDTCTNYAVPLAKSGYGREMKHGNFSARLMRAPRLKDEKSGKLPPGAPIPVFPVDALPGCPEDWIGGEGSFVCPVDSGWGLWFDWTGNDAMNTAVIASVKGMNPITGQKLDGLKLEKYEGKCPVHDVEFKTGRLCEKCGYRWPAQSYIASPNDLWWDGFRQADGTVRQFFFSADEIRDVASAVIGKKNTVPAFGFAFFEPKTRREPPQTVLWHNQVTLASLGGTTRGIRGFTGPQGVAGSKGASGASGSSLRSANTAYYNQSASERFGSSIKCSCSASPASAMPDVDSLVPDAAMVEESEEKTAGGLVIESAINNVLRSKPITAAAAVAVGAGAEIDQELKSDPLKIEEWKSEASAVIRLYFVFRPQFEQIIQKGIKDLKGRKEGYLKGVPVG